MEIKIFRQEDYRNLRNQEIKFSLLQMTKMFKFHSMSTTQKNIRTKYAEIHFERRTKRP